MQPAHVYLHAPFCARRCCYCDFAVTVDRAPDPDPWLAAIAQELEAVVAAEGWKELRLETLYVGGGTPSQLGPGVMRRLRSALGRFARLDDACEWTVEANPESFDRELAGDWIAAGVNRLSLGAQSFDAGVLRWMGRLHGPTGPARAVAAARAVGFTDISLDLIFGLPVELDRNWRRDVEAALRLEPQHVSLYGLTAEAGTPLGRRVAAGIERLADEDAYAEEYLEAAETLAGAGYRHYEVSNFARPGRESRHNLAYWTGRPFLGLGPGAHSYQPPRRRWNVRDWGAYRDRVMAGLSASEGEERIGPEAATLEQAWLELRTAEGAAVTTEEQAALRRRWHELGWAHDGAGRVRLTARGWLLLDRLAIEYSGHDLKMAADLQTF